MIQTIKKDITTVTKGIVAHGCNALGVMGAGVAYAIAKKWPLAEANYSVYCRTSALHEVDILGTVFPVGIGDVMVANCITQRSVGFDRFGNPPASLEAIRETLSECVTMANRYGLDLYTPQIGCGLGGLSWDDVEKIYNELSEKLNNDLNWYVCTI